MKRFKVQFVIFIAILVAILGTLVFRSNDISDARQAEDYYRKGETATTIYERTEAFNQALALFLKLDDRFHPKFGTGRLPFNIGNTYFQLGEYPFSILYYKRAEKLMPRSEPVKRNLSQASAKAGLKMDHPQSLFDLFLLKPFLSLPERLQLFAVFAALTLIFASAWLWTRKPWVSKTAVVFLIPAFLLFLNLVVTYYFSPIEAVLVQAAELRRDAGEEFALVTEQPILGGTVVEVLGTSPNGRWLKVVVPSGDFGFLPSESVKLIE
jgi:tetratricopeptide (TPR) repeat protein